MSKQKDTKKTYIKHIQSDKEQSSFNDGNIITINSVYEFANKKTEKIVTALYMVADCMDTKDIIRKKLRFLGVQLLSDIAKLSISLPAQDNTHIKQSLNRINEIVSLLKIAETMTYISIMNSTILKEEFFVLVKELKNKHSFEKTFPFKLHSKMFEVKINNTNTDDNKNNVFNVKDTLKSSQSMSFTNNVLKRSKTASDYKKIKQERDEKIIQVIKDKVNTKEGKDGATIKDISNAITSCSEKTIQRELLDLISKGQIKKIGAKRWSRYQINKK